MKLECYNRLLNTECCSGINCRHRYAGRDCKVTIESCHVELSLAPQDHLALHRSLAQQRALIINLRGIIAATIN